MHGGLNTFVFYLYIYTHIFCCMHTHTHIYIYIQTGWQPWQKTCQKQQPFSRLLQQVKLPEPFSRLLQQVGGYLFQGIACHGFFQGSGAPFGPDLFQGAAESKPFRNASAASAKVQKQLPLCGLFPAMGKDTRPQSLASSQTAGWSSKMVSAL